MNRHVSPRTRVPGKASVAIAIGALAVTLASCSSGSGSGGSTAASSGKANRDASLRVGIDFVPAVFDPIQNPGNQGNYTLPELYDQLVQLDAKFQPEPMLATSWEYNATGTELTMKLRSDATFNSSGSPVDATAVKVSMERAKTDPKSLVGMTLAGLKTVDAVDATTVKFTFAGPSFSFVSDLANDPRLSSVVDPAHLADLASKPAGSGPYTLTSASQASVTMTRVAKHWDSTSGLVKTIQLQGIPDQNSRFNAVKAGQLDVTYINTGQYDTAKQLVSSGKYQAFYEPKVQTYGLRVNGGKSSPLADPAVREAVSVAIDRTQFCKTAFPDMSTPTRQLVTPLDAAYDTSIDSTQALTAQPDEAKSLLSAAGKSNVSLSYLSFSTQVSLAEIVQQQLGSAGIKMDVQTQATFPAVIAGWLSGKYNLSGAALAVGDASSIVHQSVETDPVAGGVPSYLTDVYTKASTTAPGDAKKATDSALNTALADKPVNIPLCNVGLGLLATSKVTGIDSVRYLGYAPPFETRRLGKTS